MKIPDDVIRKWTNLKTYGDYKEIADRNEGVTQNDVTRAFRNGECTDTVFVAIAGFYKEREEKVRPFLEMRTQDSNEHS